MSSSNVFRDIRRVQPVPIRRRTAATVASGVIDTRANGRGERLLLEVIKGQNSGAGVLKARFFSSNTVSGTASGGTIFASTSNLTASAVGSNNQGIDIDLRKYGRFIGVTLSTGTASAIGGVVGFVGDLKVSPPSATDDGFVTYTSVV